VDSTGMNDEPAQASKDSPKKDAKDNVTKPLVYSLSPEAAQKKAIDDELAKAAIKIDLHSAEYWKAYINAIAPGKLQEGEPASKDGYQLFYIKGGFEGFLDPALRSKNADKTYYDSNFDNSDVNDALIVFDPTGERLVAAMQTVRPLGNSSTDSEFAEWSKSSHGVYTYRNQHWAGDHYNAIAVMSLHKMAYLNEAPASPKGPGAWIDMHDVAAGTLGCIGIASKSMGDFNKAYAALRQFDRDGKSSGEPFFFEGLDSQWHFQDYPGHNSAGRLSVLSTPLPNR